MIAEHKHLAERGAGLVELRLDYIRGRVNIGRLLSDRPCPVVITCRRTKDGGRWHGSEEERQVLLRTAIVSGADYVDLEEDIANLVPRWGKTQRIISFHDFKKTPANLEEIHARLVSKGADVCKLSTLANDPEDNVRMLTLVQKSQVPTIGFCMGELGIPSRILCGRFGSPFTYATFNPERSLAPGQLSFEEMTRVYGYDRINRETDVYGVIGDPIAHSYSPLLHNAAFQALNLNKVYVPFKIPPEELDLFIEHATALGIKGLSVTIPHKEAVLKKLTQLNGAVRAVSAANTVLFSGKEVVGYNTDYRAAVDCLEDALGGSQEDYSPLTGRTVLVLGAGGAAKAVAIGARRRHADLLVSNRTPERAAALARMVDGKTVDWNARHMVTVDVLVNCTPIGMHPSLDESPYDRNRLRPSMLVFDMVYNPESTLLIKDARTRGCNVVTGIEMFVRQAKEQFKLFTGQDPPLDLLRETLRRAISPARSALPIPLSGPDAGADEDQADDGEDGDE